MKQLLLALILFFPLAADAQERKTYPFEKLYQELDTMSVERRTQVEANIKNQEEKLQKEQVKSIGGIPFGTSKDKALPILKMKYGEPYIGPSGLDLLFHSVSYAGMRFDNVVFSFQSDGVNTYFNNCIFGKNAKTFSEALDIEKDFADRLSEKYTMMHRIPDQNGNPMHVCGISPFWNGKLKDLSTDDNMAIHTSIIESERSVELSTGAKYIVRLIYGSYNYVKEEF